MKPLKVINALAKTRQIAAIVTLPPFPVKWRFAMAKSPRAINVTGKPKRPPASGRERRKQMKLQLRDTRHHAKYEVRLSSPGQPALLLAQRPFLLDVPTLGRRNSSRVSADQHANSGSSTSDAITDIR